MERRITKNGRSSVQRLKKAPAFEAEYDVAVVGLGTAGAVAFRTAVEQGMKTLGVERLNGMGGLATIGIVCFGGGLNKRLENYERAAERGTVAYESVLSALYVEGRRIVGIEYVQNGIAHVAGVKQLIDATGNATVSRMAGLKIRKGRDVDNVMAACARGETWINNGSNSPRPIYGNRPFDLTLTSEDFSETATTLSQWRFAHWKKQRKNARMLRPSVMVGAREECRAVTEEIATMEDAIAEKKYPNTLFYACEPEDLPVFFNDHAFESEPIRNWKVHCGLPMFRFPSSVPYGTIVAKGMENLFVPSKHFGVSHDLGGSLRMQGELEKTGFAAAHAAKISIETGCAAKDVPYESLKPHLEKFGCLRVRPGCGEMNVYHGKRFEPFTDEQVVDALHGDMTRTAEWWQGPIGQASGTPAECAAYALWTAWKRRVSGTKASAKALADKLNAAMLKEERYAGNYAIALGLMKDKRAIPVLREIVANPGCAKDPVIKNAYPNRVKALDLLRNFKDKKSVPVMQEIVADKAKKFVAGLPAANAFGGGEPVCRFQALSYAIMALKEMGAKIPKVEIEPIYANGEKVNLAERLNKLIGV